MDEKKERSATPAASPVVTFTGCFPTIASATTGYAVLRATLRVWSTKPTSRKPSIDWRTTSSATSIATVCLRWHARPTSKQRHRSGESRDGRELNRARGPILLERGADVSGAGVLATIADPGLVDHRSVISARSAETQVQRARHRGLRPSRIRRTVFARIAPYRLDRAMGRKPGQDRC